MIVSLSWRNVWRSKLRSSVIIIAITLGICAGIFSAAFYKGMAEQRINKAIKSELSYIQIHDAEFRNTNEIHDFISESDKLYNELSQISGVSGVSNRIIIYSMASSAETGSGVKIIGIEPENERLTTNIHEKLLEGNYFEGKNKKGDPQKNQLVIGEKLAKKLKVKLNSKVVITVLDVDNNIAYGAYRIVGIFNTINNNFDEGTIFVKNKDLTKLINLPANTCHEIAISLENGDDLNLIKSKIEEKTAGLEVKTWLELSPEMSYLSEGMDVLMYLFIIIILFALLFGIVNTMLMVVLERVKEIGMLMAVGMSRLRIFLMILLETVFLSITGGVVGVILGLLISKHFETNAIDLSIVGEGFTEMGYDPFVYTSIDYPLLVNVTILVILTGVIASIYPAIKALKQDPSEALRSE